MYEKFFNDCGSVNNDTYSNESREDDRFVGRNYDQVVLLNQFMKPGSISLEAGEDDPFGGIGDVDDGGADFGDTTGGDAGGDDPFDDIGDGDFDFDGADDNTDDLFGSPDDDQSAEQKRKALILDRAEAIKEDYDVSRQIRTNFPKKFLELKTILGNNIRLAERTTVDQQYDDVLAGIVTEYERMLDLIEAYIEVMAKKTYDDIFATYVSMHTSLMRLKNLYIEITGGEVTDEDRSKYERGI